MATISFTFCALLFFSLSHHFSVLGTESKTAANRLVGQRLDIQKIAKSIGMSETTARKYCRAAVVKILTSKLTNSLRSITNWALGSFTGPAAVSITNPSNLPMETNTNCPEDLTE